MKVAVVGSRSLMINNLENFLPADTDEIVSGEQKVLIVVQEDMLRRKEYN